MKSGETIDQSGSRIKGRVCWIAGGHDWSPWRAAASGWPMRTCIFCGARQIRLDPSW